MDEFDELTEQQKLLREVCEAAGGQSNLARLLGLRSQGSVSRWIKRGRIPAERVLAVEAASGFSRYQLRPDIYPRDSAA